MFALIRRTALFLMLASLPALHRTTTGAVQLRVRPDREGWTYTVGSRWRST